MRSGLAHPYCPPAPRLVCIEPNPGPSRNMKGNGKVKQPMKEKIIEKITKKKSPQRDRSSPAFGLQYTRALSLSSRQKRTNPSSTYLDAQGYLRSLRDPFFSQLGKLGFGTFIPTSVHSGWLVATKVTTATNFVVDTIPCSGGGAYGCTRLYQSASPTTILGNPTDVYPLTNNDVIALQAQTARVVTGGLRVTAKVAANVAMGRLGGFYLADDSDVNVRASTCSVFQNLSTYRDFNPDVAGLNGGQVAYRPKDLASFDFSPEVITGYPVNVACPHLMVVGTGWPIGTVLEFSVHISFETLGGLDLAGDDDYSPPSITMDQVSSVMATLPPPVSPSITALESLDSALSNIRRSQSRTGSMRGLGPDELVRRLSNYSSSVFKNAFPDHPISSSPNFLAHPALLSRGPSGPDSPMIQKSMERGDYVAIPRSLFSRNEEKN